MRKHVEIENPEYGFSWCEIDGTYYVTTDDDEYRRISESVLSLLRSFARGELTKAGLQRQIDGGESVLAAESNVSAEEVLSFVESYIEAGVLRADEPVVQIVPPEDIRLWPRAGLLFVVLSILGIAVVDIVVQLDRTVVERLDLATILLTLAGSWLFIVVHELGHYVTSNRHFEPSVRVDLVNGIVPAVVTDTTGSWMLPRNRRVWINLAGPLLELLAVLPVVGIYYVRPDSLLVQLLLLTVFGHVFFSLNPLIHGDGYWMACDLLDVVNVRGEGIEDLAARQPSLRAAYVVASYGFGAVLFLNMTVVMLYVWGLTGLLFIIPIGILFVLSRTDYELQPSWG